MLPTRSRRESSHMTGTRRRAGRRASLRAAGVSAERLGRIRQALEPDIAQGKLPGAVVLVARRGTVVYWEALGTRAPGGPSMQRDDIFRIHSMTKPIVSVAVMMLVEEG